MKQATKKRYRLRDWRTWDRGMIPEAAYPVALGLVVLVMAWLLVKLP